MRIDLNADMGEGFGPWSLGDDAKLLQIVTTANVACGFHAGDPEIMRKTAEMARAAGVAVGAHPGYDDLAGFGRRPVAGITEREIENLVAYQTGAFASICALAGHRMTHVKTHGALGNACADDDALALAVARGIGAVDRSLRFMVMPGTATERAAERLGLAPIREVYADRTYGEDFNLTSRRLPGAVIHDAEVALRGVLRMLEEGSIQSVGGKILAVGIDSVCLHGDTPGAVALARHLRAGLEAAGYEIAAAAFPDLGG
jgi:5-oxoprolinase (ATP-hydrolysing) subunit A